MIYTLTVANFFTPTQTLASNIRGLSVTSVLNVTHKAKSHRINLVVTNSLLLRHTIRPNQSIKTLTVTNSLFLAQEAVKGHKPDPVLDFLHIWQTIRGNKDEISPPGEQIQYEVIPQSITLIQTLDVTKGKKPVTSTLSFSQTISVVKSITLSVTNTFLIAGRQTAYTTDPYFTPGNQYEITEQPKVILNDLVTQLLLRRPDFGDVERYEATRIMRRTRAGTLLMFRKPYWPTSRTLNYSFSYLCAGTGQKLLAFLQKNLGRSFFLTTHEGIVWKAICMTPSAELIQQVRGGQAITLEFQIYPP